MNRQELIKDMKAFSGSGFITRHQLMEYMGYKDPHKIDHYLRDLQSIKKRYFIPDVATQLHDALS